RVLLLPQTRDGLIAQLGAALAGGNEVVVAEEANLLPGLPQSVARRIRRVSDWRNEGPFAGALIEGEGPKVQEALAAIAALPGPIALPQAGAAGYRLDWLVEEVSTSINTTAAGGNASLMAMV
ncbi:MAG: trifunctional transcriptional regulator/proline dehydrogenase/L-glutamate gamma-semialdehyde dehydrogenase, partial [Sphingomonas bacterium]